MSGSFHLIDGLSVRWHQLSASLQADTTAASQVWWQLCERFCEPHRRYHDLSHVTALLAQAERWADQIQDTHIVHLAIWFHDAVYDPQRRDNEARSADLARCALLAMEVEESLIPSVTACIAATAGHRVTTTEVADMPLFLDLDLTILGSDPGDYARYCAAIRAEYAWVEEAEYRATRSKVLQSFLDRPVLYFTEPLRAEYEARARENMRTELQTLSSI
ncbi:MAG: N-methyl-D-aspartate receptor NMDAR2C subunit [Oxalicibacterium faecigallinarum]|uniref:HD domain-containing protein n=1 Tax=Oxalicibacterium faecigallinarum TaxID=573741 RepID=UPI0028097E80|nr:N-methyl-D-aspartate receptor NMDAR2C subunit [Oxalicibacterium faecigallinarum]MDQ7968368.1 N-methyl-D-aspartate receptor NMDAR2C subunit [Oxalicibacterium faecigallinarum]